MVDDTSNFPANKIPLIDAMIHLSKLLDLDTCQLIVGRLQPHVIGGAASDWDNSMTGQLSPFKFETDSPADVSGYALYCQATIAGDHPDGIFVASVVSGVETSLLVSDVRIRRAGVAAAGKLPILPKSVLNQLISSTRDPDSPTATYACMALSDRTDLVLDDSQWEFLVTGIRSSLAQPNALLRRAAALCIRHLERAALSTKQSAVVGELKRIVQSDIHFFVRQALAVDGSGGAKVHLAG